MANFRVKPIRLTKKHILFVILPLVIVAYWLFHKSSVKDNSNPVKVVETLTLKKADIQETIHLLGTIRPKHVAVLTAKGSGILDIMANPGETISKNGLIAKIDNPDNEKSLQLSETAEQIARQQYQRLADPALIKKGYVSPKEADEQKQIWLAAQKELAQAKLDLDNLRFYAPFDGVVGVYKKREGMQVTQGDAIVTIYDPKSLAVDIDLPCSTLPTIRVGQTVKLLNRNYKLSHVQAMLDEETHMCPADIDIVCKECLIGSTVELDLLVREQKNVIVVPSSAIFLRNGAPFVYILDGGKIKLASIKTGLKDKSTVEITEGLQEGQKLIIKGQERLYPGMSVSEFKPQPIKNASL
ncbi:efflux RND transporter periplasmic adaptor subunit [Legionella sp. 16cNR16C]|uniref:efflux RND transporter periplasmic adaptor subunit n=1 Tax=Legionella sp. 16cNR16C TaxID=2905656 RepID=UPI001E447EE5|nr:efflux RND transporter periplasmic adaptor subunit [Legionella sp. 16cNR16C]MCE3044488.1 efflux RND transporter periplasmic adaptor subunit [Legionella sp. 16cNR16C]